MISFASFLSFILSVTVTQFVVSMLGTGVLQPELSSCLIRHELTLFCTGVSFRKTIIWLGSHLAKIQSSHFLTEYLQSGGSFNWRNELRTLHLFPQSSPRFHMLAIEDMKLDFSDVCSECTAMNVFKRIDGVLNFFYS